MGTPPFPRWLRVAEHPDAFAFLEKRHHGPHLDAESRALSEAIDARFVALIERWQRAGS